ncbi:hypothetical protein [Neobacillus sp. FSL H8-0543]|uniref:hypothetical protein n=1 Tax=Neobacillus sp. FSL H8-0543 TaxID=2954672 RepID=UPI003158FC36
MNPTINQKKKIGGWLFFLFSIMLFCAQMGYFFLQSRYNVEYTDNRIFYLINILILISLVLTIFLLFTVTKKWKMIIVSILVVLTLLLVGLMINHSKRINHIISISSDFKNVLVIKENRATGQASYYRTYYGIFARPKEMFPYRTIGEFKVKWLEKDIVAVTYKDSIHSIHQYIGTYGDRNEGSYSYVGPSIHGQWQTESVRLISDSEGITIDNNGEVEIYDWKNIVQFGTIAVVLMKNNEATLMNNNEAEWTIALNENFNSNSNAAIPPSGEITLYKATMDIIEPLTLVYEGEADAQPKQ